ncbi:TPA: YSIRK-targeted surface antigen transcriptional regulator [Enterococcus faecalis]
MVFNEELILVREYKSNRTVVFPYDFQSLIKKNKVNIDSYNCSCIAGECDELFLLYINNKTYCLLGPIICNKIDKDIFNQKSKYKNIKVEEKEQLFNLLDRIPLFSLGDIRNIFVLLHYIFTGEVEDLLHVPLHNYVKSFEEEITVERVKNILYQNYDLEKYICLYENKILEYVGEGEVDKLKDMLFDLGDNIIPSTSGYDSLRSEKNYSIIVFEKLAQSAVNMGMDVIQAYQIRDSFMRESEFSTTFHEILKIRDAAIIVYTSEIKKIKSKKLSLQVLDIVQYIGLNIYDDISVKKIAEYFSISDAKLRLLFKEEIGISTYEYIVQMKILESKKC